MELYRSTAQVAGEQSYHPLRNLTPCGTGSLCLIDGGAFQSDLVILRGTEVLARVTLPDPQSLMAVGQTVVVRGVAQSGPWRTLYDESGTQLLKLDGQTELHRIDPATIVEVNRGGDPTLQEPTEVQIYGIGVPDMTRTDLGRLPVGRFLISVDSTTIVTANADGVVIYRIG